MRSTLFCVLLLLLLGGSPTTGPSAVVCFEKEVAGGRRVRVVSTPLDKQQWEGKRIRVVGMGPEVAFGQLSAVGGEAYAFSVVSTAGAEEVGSLTNYEFDFVEHGAEKLEVLDCQWEPGTVVAVYSQHGTTAASIWQRAANGADGKPGWAVAATQALAGDADLAGGRVVAASLSGSLEKQTMKARLTASAAGAPAAPIVYSLRTQGGRFVWTRDEADKADKGPNR